MSNDKYTKALTELKVILENSEDEIIKKIPRKFIMFVEKNCDKNYFCNIKPDISINNQNILDETKYLIALVYRSYLCDENEKKEYDKILQKNEENYQKKLHEKYNIDIFENNRQKIDVKENVSLPVEIKKDKFFKKIISKVMRVFKSWSKK